ncbi:hybrid sensor histidine kinase/response regulator [Fischerella thermalis]|uniref:hybrid sensor histidine kinase/response regulator n=1 Tax=Fischerella thermalis TaxID=372787 RepID=UPI000C801967|nr:hybrid sensor histidine kinase/response regulator [Fischerella thermalis]PLZ11232.1 hybrid sensor histidine kinase/response regulator [Fischerella thermalis WC119]PLZ28413.1 hybrid sensor histidine kinase/response regulator [Fischerella thermalis WC341]PLZ33561.1 hybrid sensor histidine kinase/response regulator [Fischerella thermalis WC559]PLZ34935.1 hybrid sensor histidine kinase/response regulator [Fischerella thermalis WC558]PLZ55952.1 hybrid sensor histidine kinase/response regulator [
MSQDKELEIQMQFLEEATDYLNTLEGILLEIETNHRIAPDKINAALRAAHSIKGGAGMMGFRSLSDLAHRLEDSFKVLKTRKNSLEIDTELQSLLLSGVDWLRQIVELHSEGNTVDEQWLSTFCYPVFDELHQILGDPTPEDASTILSPEDDGQNIIPLLFETEVEGCLQRLESVLADHQQPCLKEELAIMAAELGGLGEMLQLEAFTQLCESIAHHLDTAQPDEIEEIARASLTAWRRSQALVLTNQLDSLPTELDLEQTFIQLSTQPSTTQELTPQFQQTASTAEDDEILQAEITAETWLDEEIIAADFEALEAAFADESNSVGDELGEPTPINAREIPVTDYKFVEPKREAIAANKDREIQENTVRVPSKQLEQINDLFGELIIQRNGLNLQLERLRKLIRNLSQRVQSLERENQELRTAYDRIATQAVISAEIPSLPLPGGSGDQPAFDYAYQTQDIESKFDALEMDRYNDLNLLSQEVMETIVQVQEVTADIQLSVDDTDQIARKLNKTSKQLQRKLTQVRMRPLSDIVDRFPRALRDLCVEFGKNVQLKIEGASTLIERSILEALNEPLMHLMRNAFDHGIEDAATRRACGKPEQGTIEIKATHQGNRTIITIKDDGRGISLDKIRARALAMGLDATLLAQATDEELLSLIFEPGFSTSEQVTTLSGRGVGMDVVRSNLKHVRGDVKVDTVPGVGTTFTLLVPFTLSVARVLLVESNRMLLAFPTDAVSEIFLLQNEHVFPMAGSEVINWQGTMLPLIRLSRYLEFNCYRYDNPNLETPPAINAASVLIIEGNNQPIAIQIDRCWGEQEVAIRRVEGNISLPAGFSNCTILGDGRVVALVNVNELLYWIAANDRTPRTNQLPSARLKTVFLTPSEEKTLDSSKDQKGTILIVDDSINVRRFLALTLEKGGYLVEQAKDGQDALEKLQSGLKVQAVICDIEMPRIDGYGFLGRVKSNNEFKNIPVAMLTSRSSDKHRQLAMQLGARAYFSKPYNEQELLRTLEEIIFPLAEANKN